MAFPTEFPNVAFNQVVAVATGKDKDPARTTLAVYELVGYGLFLALGDVKYLMNASPETVALANHLKGVAFPEVAAKVLALPWKDMIADLEAAFDSHTRVGLIIALTKFVTKYGPEVAAVVKDVIAVFNQLKG